MVKNIDTTDMTYEEENKEILDRIESLKKSIENAEKQLRILSTEEGEKLFYKYFNEQPPHVKAVLSGGGYRYGSLPDLSTPLDKHKKIYQDSLQRDKRELSQLEHRLSQGKVTRAIVDWNERNPVEKVGPNVYRGTTSGLIVHFLGTTILMILVLGVIALIVAIFE